MSRRGEVCLGEGRCVDSLRSNSIRRYILRDYQSYSHLEQSFMA